MTLTEIKNKINNNEYDLVSDTISINKVYKFVIELNDKYEKGYLYLPINSGIKEHTHTIDIERYRLIEGILSVNNEETKQNICLINEKHNIDLVNQETIIEYTKIKKEYLPDNLTSNIFENFDF